MSEERRKRQLEREGKIQPTEIPRQYFIWGGVILLLAAAFVANWYYTNHRYDNFARCLASKHVKMYGLSWCPHCIEQKGMFGKAFQYVPYQECVVKGSREIAPECKAVGTKNFPSWQFEGAPLHEGELQVDELADRSGCSLP